MNSANIHFNIRLLLLTAVLGIAYYFLENIYSSFLENAFGNGLLIYFFVISSLSFFLLERFSRANPKEFVLAYLAALTVKFLTLLTLIIVYFKVHEKLTMGFSSVLLSLFLIYTVFELLFYLKWLKK